MTTASVAAQTLQSFNPATGELVGEVPITAPTEIPAIIARARAAQVAWAATPARDRAALIKPAGQHLIDSCEQLGELLTREMGKPLPEGVGEVRNTGAAILDEADEIAEAVQPRILLGDGVRTTMRWDPIGVVAAITPWNFPISMPQWMVLPALITGSAVVLKPSERTPLIAQAFAEALQRVLPENVLQIVHGESDQGRALVAGDIDLIAFTGSCDVGKRIAAAAGEGLKRVILELGSKDPLIVLDGADLDAAAAFAARNSFRNCGQVCVSTERIYVESSIANAFTARLVELAKDYPIGDGMAEGTAIGPMIDGQQKLHVLGQLTDAVGRGAQIAFGGGDRPGNFVEPTVLTGVTHEMDIMRDETFGPIACVMPVRDADEAVTMANDTPFGLGAVVFGPDAEARRVADRLSAGMIGVNRGIGGAPGSPWVGARHSGMSYHAGPDGHRQFCQVRVVSEVR